MQKRSILPLWLRSRPLLAGGASLRGRTVSLFPDLGATDYWRGKIPMMRQLGIYAQLYDYLERAATDEQRRQGLDIADFLLDIETDEGKLEQMRLTNQSVDKLIN